MTTSNETIVNLSGRTPKAPRGFTTPAFDPAFPNEVWLFFDGPSQQTGTALGEILSAYSATQGGFTVTIHGEELPLSVAQEVLRKLTQVVDAVEAAAKDFNQAVPE